MAQEDRDTKMFRVIGKSWADDEFRRKLMAEPESVMKAEGFTFPTGVKLRVVEDTDNVLHIVLPVKTTPTGELSDAVLDQVAGGGRKTATAKTMYS